MCVNVHLQKREENIHCKKRDDHNRITMQDTWNLFSSKCEIVTHSIYTFVHFNKSKKFMDICIICLYVCIPEVIPVWLLGWNMLV